MIALRCIGAPLLALALGPLFGASAAYGASTSLQSCTGGKISAIDQYCETIPAATGGHAPEVGSPSLAATLPPALAVRIARGPYRVLLGLPAGSPARRTHGGSSARHPVASSPRVESKASVSSLSGTLIAIMAGAALLLAGVAALSRRRNQRST